MSGRGIRILDDHIANKIAAGEVIERPASVVKELVENALDAGAKRIEIEIRQGGKEYIRVTDDGAGIAPEDVPRAFARHATSKIRSADDLFNVSTLGFRGEALPSIAAVADVELRTRTQDATGGVRYTIVAGRPGGLEPVGAPVGTTVVVRRLFFNTPARFKFLRTEAAERRRVADVAARVALAWPDVAFRMIVDGRQVFATAGDGDLAGAIRAVYGHVADSDLVPVDGELNGLRVSGFVGKPDVVHGNRDRMSVFLNGRWIQSAAITRAIEQGYDTMLPPRRYPLAVIHLTVDPKAVDVNVHPTKAEVRFKDDGMVFRAVLRAVRSALLDANLVGVVAPSRPIESQGGTSPSRAVLTGQLFAPPTPRLDGVHGAAAEQNPSSATVYGERATVQRAPSFESPQAAERVSPWRTPSAPSDRAADVAASAAGSPFPAAYEAAATAVPSAETEASPPESATARGNVTESTSDVDARQTLRELTIVGQLHRTYILGETGDGLWIIDQHVAHERVLYEQFLARSATGRQDVQQLLIPVTISLPPHRVGLVEQFADELARLGFIIEPFGGTSYIVRGVPVELGAVDERRLSGLIEELLEMCEQHGRWSDHHAAAALACKAAIKAGQPLDASQMRKLLHQLADAENPFACPHGRPIVVELGRFDLERRFGRR